MNAAIPASAVVGLHQRRIGVLVDGECGRILWITGRDSTKGDGFDGDKLADLIRPLDGGLQRHECAHGVADDIHRPVVLLEQRLNQPNTLRNHRKSGVRGRFAVTRKVRDDDLAIHRK
jgi:hypothetical protein